MLRIDDGYTAYCFDEVCCWMLSQIEEGRRPFFGRENTGSGAAASVNSRTVEILRQLGAEVKGYD